jgi:hypothetical protein
MDAREYFNLANILHSLKPTEREFEFIFKAAVSVTTYDGMRGAKSPFPNPLDFIESYFGYVDEDAPVWPLEDRHRSTAMLRATSRLIEYLNKQRDNLALGVFDVCCPICDEASLFATIGFGITWNDRRETPEVDYDHLRMLALDVTCNCRSFTTLDFDLVEALAREEVRVKLD